MKRPRKMATKSPYTVNQLAEMLYDYWRSASGNDDKIDKPALAHIPTVSIIADQQREWSLVWPIAPGDARHAHGAAQWHKDREDVIRRETGIDILRAGPIDQQRAMAWEMQHKFAGMWARLTVAKTTLEACTLLVARYEFSGNRARDIARQVPFADHWDIYFAQRANNAVAHKPDPLAVAAVPGVHHP
jgi:hypothetical protein